MDHTGEPRNGRPYEVFDKRVILLTYLHNTVFVKKNILDMGCLGLANGLFCFRSMECGKCFEDIKRGFLDDGVSLEAK